MMTDKFLIYILSKCGIRVKWYTDQYSPTGYGYLYFLEGFSEEPKQIDESVAMETAYNYIMTQFAAKTGANI